MSSSILSPQWATTGMGDDDDDDDWQEMPVIRSNSTALDDEDKKKFRYLAPEVRSARLSPTAAGFSSNATGNLLDLSEAAASRGEDWREKSHKVEESNYTRVGLDDDPDEDNLNMRTQYLFDDERGMTPLNQMQQTKTLLTEGQRIAYVGLCRLVMIEMIQVLKRGGHDEMAPAVESMAHWSTKIISRLYQHMDVEPREQQMIEQLAEHGVSADDLVPSLTTTHTVPNPSYDPSAATEDVAASKLEELKLEGGLICTEDPLENQRVESDSGSKRTSLEDVWDRKEVGGIYGSNLSTSFLTTPKPFSSFGNGSEESLTPTAPWASSSNLESTIEPEAPPQYARSFSSSIQDDDDGDLGDAFPTPKARPTNRVLIEPDPVPTPTSTSQDQQPSDPSNLITPLPHTLPGVSTTLTAADETVTLDIRWTVLCDLFLAVIADSVYDARSRVLIGRCAHKLGLSWMDVVRFERRLTEALEVQEGISQQDHGDVIEDHKKKTRNKRLLMVGAATIGGGLVIGLSAGLLAPVIGAGLAAGFTTIGIGGTSSFLAGAGGAAVITTAGTVTGMNIGGTGMSKRTQSVTTFQILPLHNNRRVNVFLTMPGITETRYMLTLYPFRSKRTSQHLARTLRHPIMKSRFMEGTNDDVRLPFSVMDESMGDVLSILWEPEMMGETGNIIRILTSEVLTQVGQQVLQATVLTALMSALQWPLMLTKLGYLIDNPWSNALDRARAAGSVLADVLIRRHVGVRPVSLIGFSLGARAIFYALVELARKKAYGIVQEVYLLGATVTAPTRTWRDVRGIVAGRFVNGYCKKDWILGYLYRATTGGLRTVAGLSPVDFVPDLENVDLTDVVVGHMSYRAQMPVILETLGFRVTADHFDEPDAMQEDDEPTTETSTQIKTVKEAEAKKRMILGFTKKLKASKAKAPEPASSEDDEEPERMENPQVVSSLSPRTLSSSKKKDESMGYQSLTSQVETGVSDSEEESAPKPNVHTFDIRAIRSELAQSADSQVTSTDPGWKQSERPTWTQKQGSQIWSKNNWKDSDPWKS
ncbi:hypothetical protein CROQUDRAFT_132292 [Cronartium quercuum f. sp. fusiforme G11]|uniref:DUF726-domain-containing protein n=1 Tax=Cronartium quercuum f. sp. fusiforme G11 TaxID=708437 RepID=A0A9P6NKV0_9BASI|nr:hypothetical protein CROQUDRAFT_132292 [Cronartium quercuum f. sp. fusiforme G11]